MPTTSAPPPPPSGGNLKYVALGLVFLLAAGGLWMVMGKEQPPPPAPVAKPAEPARVNPMAEPQLALEEPEPEPEPVVEETPTEPKKKPSGGVVRGDWDCSGDLSNPMAVINEQRAQVRACYERRLKVNNILQGELRVKLKVGSNGKVVLAAVTGSMNDSEVNSCVRKLATSWSFQPPSNGTCAVVQVPFQFSPKT